MTRPDTGRGIPAFTGSPHLPLWERVIFVDWHGVLSSQPFWASSLTNARHPCHSPLTLATNRLFHADPQRLDAWMRGILSSADIVQSMGIELDRRFRDDFLVRRLAQDLRRIEMRRDLLSSLREIARAGFLVLATDNMDCFASSLMDNDHVFSHVDDVLCSSQLGRLKCEGAHGFFGGWLEAHELSFSRALLIDDSPINCSLFERCGGSAVRFTTPSAAIDAARRWQRTENA